MVTLILYREFPSQRNILCHSCGVDFLKITLFNKHPEFKRHTFQEKQECEFIRLIKRQFNFLVCHTYTQIYAHIHKILYYTLWYVLCVKNLFSQQFSVEIYCLFTAKFTFLMKTTTTITSNIVILDAIMSSVLYSVHCDS
jgi:hypothetical protein